MLRLRPCPGSSARLVTLSAPRYGILHRRRGSSATGQPRRAPDKLPRDPKGSSGNGETPSPAGNLAAEATDAACDASKPSHRPKSGPAGSPSKAGSPLKKDHPALTRSTGGPASATRLWKSLVSGSILTWKQALTSPEDASAIVLPSRETMPQKDGERNSSKRTAAKLSPEASAKQEAGQSSSSPSEVASMSDNASATPSDDSQPAIDNSSDATRLKKQPPKPGKDHPSVSKKGSGSKPKRERTKTEKNLEVKVIRPGRLRLRPITHQGPMRIPQLHHNLDRVLFNPGVYQMQDHRTNVFNFDPYLASIMPVDEFDFDVLKAYTTSSRDVKLRQLCAAHGLKYCGSTSSMTSILSHFHYLLSAWRKPNFENLSQSLSPDSHNFTLLSRGPAAAFARFHEGVYAIDADKEYDTENILSMLGKSMEKLLTLPKEDFEKYRRTRSHQLSEDERNAEESYHYTTMGDFMMRSQLDAHDPRLPGSGVFDLKTRAVVSIRMDVQGYQKGVGYEIRKRFGKWESFEREYYDMIRAAFLKYSLQVRMGRMDGIFVAFHNTQRIFGFQYVSLSEMDHSIHGTHDRRLGDLEFKSSLALLNELLDRATRRFPGRTLRLHVETRPTKIPLTYFFVEPVTDEEMTKIQEAGKPSVEQLEKEIRGLSQNLREAEAMEEEAGEDSDSQAEGQVCEDSVKASEEVYPHDPQTDAAWKEMMSKVDETVESESLGIRTVREAVQDALEQSGLLQGKTELESEQYVENLASALAAHASENKEFRKWPGEEEEEEAVEQEEEEEEEVIAGEAESQAAATPARGETMKPGREKEEPKPERASLTDLILKVTEGIDDKTQNLKTFQRLFADLAAHSKKSDQADAGLASSDESSGGYIADAGALPVDVEPTAGQTRDVGDDQGEGPDGKGRELMGMYVSIRNRVNGEFVERPSITDEAFDWTIQYTITELPDKRARQIYEKIKKRRKTVLSQDPNVRASEWHRMFQGKLAHVTKKGRKYREERRKEEAGHPVFVAWDRKPLPLVADDDIPAAGKE